jgi:hypothetical protein
MLLYAIAFAFEHGSLFKTSIAFAAVALGFLPVTVKPPKSRKESQTISQNAPLRSFPPIFLRPFPGK